MHELEVRSYLQVGIIMYLPEADEEGRARITAKCVSLIHSLIHSVGCSTLIGLLLVNVLDAHPIVLWRQPLMPAMDLSHVCHSMCALPVCALPCTPF